MSRPKRIAVLLAVAGLLLAIWPSTTLGAAPDPLKTDVWGKGFVGTYRFASNVTLGWMKSAISRAVGTISHTAYANPDFHLTSGSSANGTIQYLSSSTYACDISYGWKGCGDAYSDKTFRVWLASNYCWTDGTSSTCTGTKYDAETVALNEMGHVNRLSHHLPATPHDTNAAYGDAVVQAIPDPFGHPFGTNRYLRWADLDALHALYGHDPCTLPPCPLGPVP
ncbi:MAG: hypothetical protein HYX54_09935 [Chloroflexi bacterium]|nr:hypothetical protein [Chloroflexota bacterium]